MIRQDRASSRQWLSRCPGVPGKGAKPGHLVQVLDAVPARKMIELREFPPPDPFPLVREIGLDPLPKPLARLREADLFEISHEVGARSAAFVAGKLAAEREIPAGSRDCRSVADEGNWAGRFVLSTLPFGSPSRRSLTEFL